MTDWPHLDHKKLLARAVQSRELYASAAPFPHAVFDDFLPAELADAAGDHFPGPDHPGFRRRDYPEQKARHGHLQRTDFAGVHPAVRRILTAINGQVFIDFLQKLTNTPGIIPDPHYRGAGVHLTLPGGHLDLHADFNVDRFRGLVRCATAILYLQPDPRDWHDAWAGHLELWPEALDRCGVRIAPAHNRLVVFGHGESYFHGHPKPLASPEGRNRQSIAGYYYVAPGEGGLPEAHGARWVKPA